MKKRILITAGILLVIILAVFFFPIRMSRLFPGSSASQVEVLNRDLGYDAAEQSYWDYYVVSEGETLDQLRQLLKDGSAHLTLPLPGSSPAGAVTIGLKSGNTVMWIAPDGLIRIEQNGKLRGIYQAYSKDIVDRLYALYGELETPIEEKQFISAE